MTSRIRSGRLSMPLPSGSAAMSNPNLVAITTWSRNGLIDLPTSCSLVPVPLP